MFRFVKDIVRISEGDLKSWVHIRKGDQFEVLALSLNVMVESLNKKVSSICETIDALAEYAEKHAHAEE